MKGGCLRAPTPRGSALAKHARDGRHWAGTRTRFTAVAPAASGVGELLAATADDYTNDQHDMWADSPRLIAA